MALSPVEHVSYDTALLTYYKTNKNVIKQPCLLFLITKKLVCPSFVGILFKVSTQCMANFYNKDHNMTKWLSRNKLESADSECIIIGYSQITVLTC